MLEAFTRAALPAEDHRQSAGSDAVLDDSSRDMDEDRLDAEPTSMPRERHVMPMATRMRLRGA